MKNKTIQKKDIKKIKEWVMLKNKTLINKYKIQMQIKKVKTKFAKLKRTLKKTCLNKIV